MNERLAGYASVKIRDQPGALVDQNPAGFFKQCPGAELFPTTPFHIDGKKKASTRVQNKRSTPSSSKPQPPAAGVRWCLMAGNLPRASVNSMQGQCLQSHHAGVYGKDPVLCMPFFCMLCSQIIICRLCMFQTRSEPRNALAP